jgi:hypothetical protein
LNFESAASIRQPLSSRLRRGFDGPNRAHRQPARNTNFTSMQLPTEAIAVSQKIDSNTLSKKPIAERLPRYRRAAPTEQPRFRLQDRDREIISLVHDFRVIPSGHIQRLIEGSDQKILRRLQVLFHGDYIDRINLGNNEEIAYGLGNRGADLLADMGRIERRRIDWGQKNRQLTERFLEHAMMVTDFRAILTLALRAMPDIAIQTWMRDGELRDEVLVDFRKSPVVPDGYFVLERRGQKAHYLLEGDQSTMSGRRFSRKLKAYLGYWREGRCREKLDASYFRVLTLTKSRERATNLCNIAEAVCRREEDPNARWLFWFACEQDYGFKNPASVLDPIWRVPMDTSARRLLE